ncbi:hypothetical protein MR857_03090 [bacterium]|nr:hypothetical protein [bacterium]MCI7242815.1 hypothetical protein [Lachnobacterium sp.]MDY3999458.1 hypothetical protein [Blautia sp.]
MYLERMTIDEIMELIERKGYMSFETMAILEEIESSKRVYDRLIAAQESETAEGFILENAVVRYYLFQLNQLKNELPYDAMGGQYVVPILLMQEFRDSSIVNKVRNFCGPNVYLSEREIKGEIQKFLTVHLDPQGIVLYMDILGHLSDVKERGIRTSLDKRSEERFGKRKKTCRTLFNNIYSSVTGRNKTYYP